MWQPPTLSFVSSVLHNACYAGAYVYGRRPTSKTLTGGRGVRRALEQYDEADPRNRLVAGELEGRWNRKLEALEGVQDSLTRINQERSEVGETEREEKVAMGRDFGEVWLDKALPIENKKKILRTVVEEAVVDLDEDGETLRFVVHWKGGAHTRFEMHKPASGVGRKTSLEDLDVIRKMAAHYSDDKTAAVLSKLGRRTATGKRWNQSRVGAVRRRYKLGTPVAFGHEVLPLGSAAKYCGVSQTTIKRLVASGLLPKEQAVPYAPREIQRSDLESKPVCSILDRLRKTGRLVLEGDDSEDQGDLFRNEQGSDRGRYHA